jgi:DNA-binding NtrC family response regulator
MQTLAQINAEPSAQDKGQQTTQASGPRSGRDHLEHRSRLKVRLSELAPISNLLIIDDTSFDADVLASILRLVFDPGVRIRHVRFAREIRKALADEMPQLIFLDDRLGHGTSAEVSLNVIRTAGYGAAVIVMSGLLTRARRIELMKLGVGDVVHKDDINVARVAEAVLKVLDTPQP